ncbi:Tail assembly chaperone [Methylorubrum aminovorans]
MKLSALKTDTTNTQGRWVGKIPGLGDLRLKVRPIGNPDHRRRLDELTRAVPRAERLRGLAPEKVSEIEAEAILDAVLFGWENMEGDGTVGAADHPLPFDRETAKTLLTDPAYQMFRDAVDWAADAVAVEAQQDQANDSGN